MANIEILRGSKINKSVPVQQLKTEGPGFLARLGVQALKGTEAPLHTLSNILQYLGEPSLIPGKTTSQDVMQKYGISEEQLQPQSLPESIAQKAAFFAPSALALGGFPGLQTSTIGSIAGGALQHLGAPEFVQDIGQLGTELASGIIGGKIPRIKSSQKSQYALAEQAIPGGKEFVATPLKIALREAESTLGTEVNEKIHKKIMHAIETVSNNMTSGEKISPKTAMELRRKLYQYRNELPTNVKQYIDTLTKGINESFAVYGAENPTFLKHLNEADRLTEMKHMSSVIEQFADSIEKSFSAIGGKPIKLAIKVGLKPVITSEKILKNIYKHPTARKHYFNAVTAAIKQDPSIFIKNLDGLNEIIKPEIEIPIKEQSSHNNIELLRGRKL